MRPLRTLASTVCKETVGPHRQNNGRRSADGRLDNAGRPRVYTMKSEDDLLQQVSQSGEVDDAAWPIVKDALITRLKQAIETLFSPDITENDRELGDRIISTLASFDAGPPFTIQRIAELILLPNKHHANRGKYLRALDRTLTVTSTTREFPPADPTLSPVTNGQIGEFPHFSLIPWATVPIPNERYSSPPVDSLAPATAYPLVNGVNVHSTSAGDSSTQTNPSGTTPPPIDAVDIGLVPGHVTRVAQGGGPPPRSPEAVLAIDDHPAQKEDEMHID